ncbi:MAG: hypothetical protein ACPGQL_07545 [Thermoplasmatota archaeon]
MAVPSRVYVGVVVFGLITALVTVPYTSLVLAGYRQPPEPTQPYQVLFPVEGEPLAAGEVLFLLLACAFSVALTVLSWRALLRGAREDAAKRKRARELERDVKLYALQNRHARRPPGNN